MGYTQKFIHDIDLDQNQIINAVAHKVTTLPESPVEGQFVYYQGLIMWFDGSEWVTAGASVGNFMGGFDASGLIMPENSTKGDYWFVDVAGDVDGLWTPQLEVGNMIISKETGAENTTADWVVIRISSGQATETTIGTLAIATVPEVQAGVNHQKAVTPFGLAGMKASDLEVQDETEEERLITPKGLHTLEATEALKGLIKIATGAETEEGTNDTKSLTPKKLKDMTVEFELKDIHTVPLAWILLIAPDLTIYKVTVDNDGVLQTEAQ